MQPRFGASVRQNAHPFIPSYAERLPVAGFLYLTVSGQFGDPGYPYIDFRYFVPGPVIYRAGLGKPEHRLEYPDGFRSRRAVHSIHLDTRYGRVCPGDDIDLFLELPDLIAAGAVFQHIAGPGGGNAGDLLRGIDIHVIPIIIPQDLNCRVALFSQGHGPPLLHPVGAGHPLAVAVLGQDRLPDIGPGQIICKKLIHDHGNRIKVVTLRDPFVVKCGRRGDREIVPPVPVPRNHR